jgi:hypothetical protein
VQYAAVAPACSPAGTVYRDDVTDSPLSAGELRAAAEADGELGPEYRDAVLESFVDRVGREIDARVDARLAQAAAQPLAAQRMATPPAPRAPKTFSALTLALGSIALGIPITALVVAAGSHPVGFWGLVVVWAAIASINWAYAAKIRPPGDTTKQD